MPRLTSVTSGVVVSVSDETATRLGSEWVPVDGSHASASIGETPDKSWSNKELKTYAEENQIDLGEAKNKAGFLAAIAAAESNDEAADESEEDSESDSDN